MLQFDPVAHRYTLDGRVLPSVTQVLEDVGIIDYRCIPNETREMALTRGSNVHLATQLDDEGDLDESTELMGYVEAWRGVRRHLKIDKFEPGDIERRLYHPTFFYAGTFDRRHKHRLIDIKTSLAPWWTRIQLAAYQAIIDADCKEITERIAAELHWDGTFKIYTFGVREFRDDLQTFLAALRVCNEKEMNRREVKW